MELTVPYFCPLFNDSPPIANTDKNKIENYPPTQLVHSSCHR